LGGTTIELDQNPELVTSRQPFHLCAEHRGCGYYPNCPTILTSRKVLSGHFTIGHYFREIDLPCYLPVGWDRNLGARKFRPSWCTFLWRSTVSATETRGYTRAQERKWILERKVLAEAIGIGEMKIHLRPSTKMLCVVQSSASFRLCVVQSFASFRVCIVQTLRCEEFRVLQSLPRVKAALRGWR
jgi:hypothetical protein